MEDEEEKLRPYQFEIGEFVKCSYDYDITWWAVDEEVEVFHGIIIERSRRNMYFPYGIFYKILCTDGYVRFFAEWELQIHPES